MTLLRLLSWAWWVMIPFPPCKTGDLCKSFWKGPGSVLQVPSCTCKKRHIYIYIKKSNSRNTLSQSQINRSPISSPDTFSSKAVLNPRSESIVRLGWFHQLRTCLEKVWRLERWVGWRWSVVEPEKVSTADLVSDLVFVCFCSLVFKRCLVWFKVCKLN